MSNDQKWPIPSDYSAMLQNPQIAFRQTDLQTCVVERDQNNQPRARAGAFANVYKGTQSSGQDIAIRVFTRASGKEQLERYSAISDYLAQLNGNRPQCLVSFNFLEKGIRVASQGGKWFPLLTMDWVPGDTLFDWVRGACHGQDKRGLGAASDKWVELVGDLNRVDIAHGDLQHGNVMVTPRGELRLVDYDCMCVPKLVGRPNLEIGVEPYQHPERNEKTLLYPGLDNFSALFILVALRGLTANPQLWFNYNERPHESLYDKLLFRKEDFDSPHNSSLVKELQRSSDDKVRKWAAELIGLFRIPMKDVPTLDHFVNDFEKVRELLSVRAFDEALSLLNRKSPPPDLQGAVQEAQRCVNQREKLEQAVDAGDELAMKTLYEPSLLDNYPKAKPAVEVARKSSQVISVLDQLRQFKQAQKGREFVHLWDAQASLLTNRKSAQSFLKDVEQWRRRNRLCDDLLAELKQPNPDGFTLKTYWQELSQLGGHPEVQTQQQTVLRVIERSDAFESFQQIPRDATAQHDQAVIAAWKEPLFRGWDLAEKQRHRLTAAEERLRMNATLEVVIKQHDTPKTLTGEQSILDAGRELPDGYAPKHKGRIDQADRRLQAVRQFVQLSRLPHTTESELAQAWRAVCGEQADSLVDPQLRDRAQRAIPRAPLLDALHGISLNGPTNERDAQLLKIWDEPLLLGCKEADPWRQPHADACQRRELLQTFEVAVARSDDAAIVDCVEAPLLATWRFSPLEAGRIAKAQQTIGQSRQLLETLRSGERSRFSELFCSRSVKDFSRLFSPYMQVMQDWLKTEVLPCERIGLKPATVGIAIRAVPGSQGIYHLRWTWPAPRFTDACLIKVCGSKPTEGISPDALPALQTVTVQRKNYETAGGMVVLPTKPAAQGKLVIVWAIVELGDQICYSEPLILGRLNP